MRFYLVTPLEGAQAAAPAPGPGVVVAAVRLPKYLERPQLVTRSGDNRLQLEEFHQWGGNLGKDLTRVLAENLSRLLGSDAVVAAPHTLRPPPGGCTHTSPSTHSSSQLHASPLRNGPSQPLPEPSSG